MSTDDRYLVELTDFAATHYIKNFSKKYKGVQWNITLKSIYEDLARIEEFIKLSKIETIHVSGNKKIVKQYFRVAQTKDSAKASGNRLIAFVDDDIKLVRILLVYSKNEISAPNETAKWQTVIRDNFRDIAQTFGL